LLDDPDGNDPVHVLANGCFSAALKRYLSYFPRQQIHLELHHEVLADQTAALASVYNFLGVEHDFRSIETSRVINRGVYSTAPIWFSNRLHRLRYQIDCERGRVYEKDNLAGKVGTVATYLFNHGLSAANKAAIFTGRPQVSAENRQRLLDYYLPDIVKLETVTGFDLNSWKRL
jgi:hypothetical protein